MVVGSSPTRLIREAPRLRGVLISCAGPAAPGVLMPARMLTECARRVAHFSCQAQAVYGDQLGQLPALATQTALTLGECVHAPAPVRMREADPLPRSKAPDFWALDCRGGYICSSGRGLFAVGVGGRGEHHRGTGGTRCPRAHAMHSSRHSSMCAAAGLL
jgi:hypothetical protein